MTRFEAGDVVRVLFPHVESNVRRSRPALVLTREPIGADGSLIWVAMITNAKRKPWPGDVPIEDHKAAGLPVPSVVRTAKVATLEAASASRIGRLSDAQIEAVRKQVLGYLSG
jgi:mRNA-degrading endonuclease toxin of MazEF toxin-antitoxin module